MIEEDAFWLPPSASSLTDKRLAWFKGEKERAEAEGRKPLPCPLKTRAQLLELWRKRVERAGQNSVYVGAGRVRSRGVRVQVEETIEEVCAHSRGAAESVTQVAVEAGCEGNAVTAAPTASTPAVVEPSVKPSWVVQAEADCANVAFVGFEDGEPVFRLTRAGKPMQWSDDDQDFEVARLRPKGFKNKLVLKTEAEWGLYLVGWDSDDTEIFVERTVV